MGRNHRAGPSPSGFPRRFQKAHKDGNAITRLVSGDSSMFRLPGLAPAQSATTGALAGAVVNPQGEAIPDVAVTITNAATRQTHSSTTAADGVYGFSMLPPGVYAVQFASHGFKTSRMDAEPVDISEVATLDATLERGESSEPVPASAAPAARPLPMAPWSMPKPSPRSRSRRAISHRSSRWPRAPPPTSTTQPPWAAARAASTSMATPTPGLTPWMERTRRAPCPIPIRFRS